MTVSKSNRLSFLGSNWAAMVLLVCFGMMAVIGTSFHDHDFEPSHSDSDCASCYLANANIGLEEVTTDPDFYLQEVQSVSIETTSLSIIDTPAGTSRAPPIVC
jgi:hypothetical protein